MHCKENSIFKLIGLYLLNFISIFFKLSSAAVLWYRSFKPLHYSSTYIVSVDNISFGGTGKTSLVISLGEYLDSRGIKFAVVLRGYRSHYEKSIHCVLEKDKATEVGDEAKLIKQYFPKQDVIIGRDRRQAVDVAIQLGNSMVIFDDGFQTRQIAKDFTIMLVNEKHPFYYLRNFKFYIKKNDAVLYLNNLGSYRGKKATGLYSFKEVKFFSGSGIEVNIGQSALVGFSALGDNQRFYQDLKKLNLLDFVGFPDHFFYSRQSIELLEKKRKTLHADYLVCTEKDWIKLKELNLTEIPLIYSRNSIKCPCEIYEKIVADATKKGIIQA
jgi:tetraacyldisaccharide 4'-kinase